MYSSLIKRITRSTRECRLSMSDINEIDNVNVFMIVCPNFRVTKAGTAPHSLTKLLLLHPASPMYVKMYRTRQQQSLESLFHHKQLELNGDANRYSLKVDFVSVSQREEILSLVL